MLSGPALIPLFFIFLSEGEDEQTTNTSTTPPPPDLPVAADTAHSQLFDELLSAESPITASSEAEWFLPLFARRFALLPDSATCRASAQSLAVACLAKLALSGSGERKPPLAFFQPMRSPDVKISGGENNTPT